ncbi:MAG TPA: GNAT family N-acetyltransferase [Gaiellaceae bacterium]|nr:GNAT family N-acetyltransferase [Gaiellaceae bacterium]
MIRRAETDADIAAYVATWAAVWPGEDAISADFVRDRVHREPERRYLLAEVDGAVVGTGCVARSSQSDARPTLFGVLPAWRHRGIGSALHDWCIEYSRELGAARALASVREDDRESLGFMERRGFVVTDRLVSLALDLDGDPPPPDVPPGIEISELGDAHFAEAYDVFAAGVADIPSDGDSGEVSPFEEWADRVRTHALTLVALDCGGVVGFADLELRNAETRLLDNNLTTVLRTRRRRGIAEALKRTQIAWATANGYRRIVTTTHDGNDAMRGLNEKLGYVEQPALLDVCRALGRPPM